MSEFVKEECDNNGRQKVNNLTAHQCIGLRKLKKRVSQGEIVIIESDKGKRLTASSIESYERQGGFMWAKTL